MMVMMTTTTTTTMTMTIMTTMTTLLVSFNTTPPFRNRTQNDRHGRSSFLRELFTPSPPTSSVPRPRSSPTGHGIVAPFECPTPPYVADIISGHNFRLPDQSEAICRVKVQGVCNECYKELSRSVFAASASSTATAANVGSSASEATGREIADCVQSVCDNVCTCVRVDSNNAGAA